jgi:hypothetical protein
MVLVIPYAGRLTRLLSLKLWSGQRSLRKIVVSCHQQQRWSINAKLNMNHPLKGNRAMLCIFSLMLKVSVSWVDTTATPQNSCMTKAT